MTQSWQMQALYNESEGTWASKVSGIVTFMHQHGPLYAVVEQSWQSFGRLHNGQRAVSSKSVSAGVSLFKVVPGIVQREETRAGSDVGGPFEIIGITG